MGFKFKTDLNAFETESPRSLLLWFFETGSLGPSKVGLELLILLLLIQCSEVIGRYHRL